MSGIGRSVGSESGSWGLRDGEGWEGTANRCKVTFWNDENVVKLNGSDGCTALWLQ